MNKPSVKQLIERLIPNPGMFGIGVKGVQLFHVIDSIRCAPAIYEPTVIVIVNGEKEAILDGEHYVYDHNKYMCCPITMPVEAGTPKASKNNPLLGISISLDTKMLTELSIEMETTLNSVRKQINTSVAPNLTLANWDEPFTEALYRLLQLTDNTSDMAVLGHGRLRELYYAILKGEAGHAIRSAYGVGNQIARTIEYLSARLDEQITIDDMAEKAGMSRAVFHRKFKHATRMSPIQFVKCVRLNTAAMNIANGMNVSEAAIEVGYVSSSQFSREFKRLYGQSPKNWRETPISDAIRI